MLNQKLFGEKLRNHRKRLGMTQEDVAEKIGISPQAISKWEEKAYQHSTRNDSPAGLF